MTNKLTVEQCDRDAAAHFIGIIFDEICGQETRDGKDDSDELVQAFARHRQQAEARAEGLVAAALALAISAGKLNVALDGLEKFRRHREAVIRDMTVFADALTAYRSARP